MISPFIIFSDTKVEPASVSELKEQKVGFCYVVVKVFIKHYCHLLLTLNNL